MKVLFWASILLLMYVYVAYYLFLRVVSALSMGEKSVRGGIRLAPKVSVLISAFNEEKNIKRRIENLLADNSPSDGLEIIVSSDGSADGTVSLAAQYRNRGVTVNDHKINRGRAAVQNDGVPTARGEIVVFTDAETEFAPGCLRWLVEPFAADSVGCVVANLVYRTDKKGVSESEGAYWKYEKKIRELESHLGLLATGTGACMAIRKGLWRQLRPSDDVDFTTPLDVILQGYRVVYARDAIAYDVPPSSAKRELKTRIRQTSKNLIGTLRRWGWRGWVEHPLISWSLISHKILRWLTGFLLLGVSISNLFLVNEGWVYVITLAGQVFFYALAVFGWVGDMIGKRVPVGSTVFSFCVASLGMGIGVIKGLLGRAPARYKSA